MGRYDNWKKDKEVRAKSFLNGMNIEGFEKPQENCRTGGGGCRQERERNKEVSLPWCESARELSAASCPLCRASQIHISPSRDLE